MPGSFLESFVRVGKESVWGTAKTDVLIAQPTLTWDVNPAYDQYQSQMIVGAAGQAAPVFGVKRVTGRWTLEGGYTGLDVFSYGVLGAFDATGAGDPFTNTYTPSSTLPSFTVHASYGNLPSGTVAEVQGLKFNSVEWSGDAASGFMNVSADVIAEEYNHNDTTGVTAVAAAHTITHEPIAITPAVYSVTAAVGVLDIGIGTAYEYCIRSFNFKVDRFLTTSRICLGRDTIGEPVPDRPMAVTGQFVVEHKDFALYDALTDKTVNTTAQLKWDGGTHTISFVWPKLVYTNISTPIQSGDVLLTTVSWLAYGTAGTATTAEPMNIQILSSLNGDVIFA